MVEPHDGEPDTSEAVIRALLAKECPHWRDVHLQYLDASGTENAMWRGRVEGGPDVVVRLPRHPGAAKGAHLEHQLLQHLEASPLSSIVAIPKLLHIGSPHEGYPHTWSVLAWLDGRDAWTARHEIDNDSPQLAASLAEVVNAIGSVGDELPVPRKGGGDLGITLRPHIDVLIEQVDRSRSLAGELFDVAHVLDLADEAYALRDATTARFLHDDLLPGNLLIDQGRVSAVLDWGGACYGDPARDLAVAWSVLGTKGRQVFRQILTPDDATWARGRALELCHAVDAVLRYVPRRHAVGEVMATTLHRILSDARDS